MIYLSLLLFFHHNFASGWAFGQQRLQHPNVFKPAPSEQKRGFNSSVIEVVRRAITTYQVTCGFFNGDVSAARTAQPGYDCRFDTLHALWGFCPTMVIAATDCGLAGNCVDSYACSNGCGITDQSDITTFSCTNTANPYCSTLLLSEGVDQIYSYIACGPSAKTDILLAQATNAATTAVSIVTISASAAPSSAIPVSTTSKTTTATSSTSTSVPVSSQPTSASASKSGSASGSTSTSQSSSSNANGNLVVSYNSTTAPSATSSTFPTNSESKNTATNIAPASNLGAIIGGVLGALALICVFVLAILFLRMRRRLVATNEMSSLPRTPSRRWWSAPWTTEMQTAGIHEKEGSGIFGYGNRKAEKDGIAVHEMLGSTRVVKVQQQQGQGGRAQQRYELPCEM